MPPKEPTRAQYSSRLTYQGHTPAFLLKLQNQVAGRRQDEDEPQYEDGGVDEFGRERRPPITDGPDDNERRSNDESDEDEKPVIVVLKEGKHLSQLDVINEGRKAKGLPPLLSESKTIPSVTESEQPHTSPLKVSGALSFSTKKEKATNLKRKFPEVSQKSEELSNKTKKKSKKSSKGALSFDRDEVG